MSFYKIIIATSLVLSFSLNVQAKPDITKTYAPVDVVFEAVKVSKHVYFVQGMAGAATQHKGFISNAGFVVTNDGVVVFDALGTPSLAIKLVAEIQKVTDKPIKYVVMSHYHADHIYGLQVFKELGAKIIAPQGARVYLASDLAENLLATRRTELKPWIDDTTHIVYPDKYIDKEHQFSLGGIDFKLTPLGNAHSEGDLTLLVSPDNVLFSGDLIFEGRIPFIGRANILNWLNALDDMRNVNVSAVLPGHGPLAKDPNELVKSTYNYLSLLKDNMQKAVEDWIPFEKAYEKIDWGEYMFMPAFDEANRRNAYNVFLFMEQTLP